MPLDTTALARAQFAMTIIFHYLFPPLSIGLGALMVVMEGLFLRTGDVLYEDMTRFWSKIFAVNFAMGVASGIVMEFQFGTNWSHYSRFVGLFTVATAAMHGSIYLHLKTEGELHERLRRWTWRCFGVFAVLYVVTTIATLVVRPSVTRNFETYPAAWVIVALNALAVANIPRALHRGRPLYAFVSSSCTIAALVFLFGAALFPDLVTSSLDPAWSLTIDTAASSDKTLRIMLVVAALGMPFVATYTAVVYWIFRGKVKLGKFSY